jgi:hypothetical protein
MGNSDHSVLQNVDPVPASAEARKLGCICPIGKNNHGAAPPFAPGTTIGGTDGGWLFAPRCPIHAATTLHGAYFVER